MCLYGFLMHAYIILDGFLMLTPTKLTQLYFCPVILCTIMGVGDSPDAGALSPLRVDGSGGQDGGVARGGTCSQTGALSWTANAHRASRGHAYQRQRTQQASQPGGHRHHRLPASSVRGQPSSHGTGVPRSGDMNCRPGTMPRLPATFTIHGNFVRITLMAFPRLSTTLSLLCTLSLASLPQVHICDKLVEIIYVMLCTITYFLGALL
jgi:hypothetical protein